MFSFSGIFVKSAALALFGFLAASSVLAADFPTEALEIHRHDGKSVHFTVELATDNASREQGLMNRDTMQPDHGMLFDFGNSRPVYMWMKNTYLPLDMLFISKAGKITQIRENTLPLSEDIIDSHGPVRFVLELNAGTSRMLGITTGDVVTSPQIALAAKTK
jgi:uncharacterized membrane protein (UPF0127 family)